MKAIVPGHVYDLTNLGDGHQRIVFLRRSGGAVQYDIEWDGLQTQEVLRALIDRTAYLNNILPCNESGNALWHLRMALFEYEARAYRRKVEEKNRRDGNHNDTNRPRAWHPRPYNDVPFNEQDIEKRPTGPDGHIVLSQEEKEMTL